MKKEGFQEDGDTSASPPAGTGVVPTRSCHFQRWEGPQLQAHPSLCSMPRHSLLPGACLEEGRVQE